MPEFRIGLHTSRAGSLENAALRAHELEANTFQIFSSSPRQWRANPPDLDDVRRFQDARRRFDLNPLAIHVNYLINLASLDPVIRHNSIRAFRGELERAALIGAEYLVTHPGNYKSWTAQEGIAAFVLGVQEAARGLDCGPVTILLENTVGAGAQLGGKLSELRAMRDLLLQLIETPVGYCLDTCHLFGAGFNVSTADGVAETLREAQETLGLEHVHVIHANDSKGSLGSHLDRHANIGEGSIGEEGFRLLLQHPALRSKPFILETPMDEEGADRRDLETLRRLAAAPGPKDKSRKAGKGN
jgi:deoxyribonuclease-4